MIFKEDEISWQAHRGGGSHDAPDNTLVAIRYGWNLAAIPEIDMRLTADDELICLHDDTLARTTDAPLSMANLPVRQITLAKIKKYDAGKKFAERYGGERVPALREVFDDMRTDRSRRIYADIKNYDTQNFPIMLKVFTDLVAEYGIASQIIACGCDYSLNMRIKNTVPGINVMQWIGYWGPGDAGVEKLKQFKQLETNKFAGLDEVQIHLNFNAEGVNGWHYDLTAADLTALKQTCLKYGVPLQVFPFDFTEESLRGLYNLGITHYVTDEPARFKKTLDEIKRS